MKRLSLLNYLRKTSSPQPRPSPTHTPSAVALSVNFTMILPMIFALAACDKAADELGKLLDPHDTNVVVISTTPEKISSVPIRYQLRKPAEVVGTINGVCLSLRGDVPLRDAETMNAHFNSLMRGASITVIAMKSDGKQVVLDVQSQTWSKVGRVAKNDELSACIRASKDSKDLPRGTLISEIAITSSADIDIGGVFWESTEVWDEARTPPKPAS
jgi:hypothetical protein